MFREREREAKKFHQNHRHRREKSDSKKKMFNHTVETIDVSTCVPILSLVKGIWRYLLGEYEQVSDNWTSIECIWIVFNGHLQLSRRPIWSEQDCNWTIVWMFVCWLSRRKFNCKIGEFNLVDLIGYCILCIPMGWCGGLVMSNWWIDDAYLVKSIIYVWTIFGG